MRARMIGLSGIQLNDILHCTVEKEVNQHGRATIMGYIDCDSETELLNNVSHNYFLEIVMSGEQEGETETLFQGVIERVKIESTGHLKKATIILTGATRLMDRKKKDRAFQNAALTYDDLIKVVNGSYEEADAIIRSENQPIEDMITQYQETDWEFVKRLASRLSSVIVPYYKLPAIRYSIGSEDGNVPVQLEAIRYCETNNVGEFFDRQLNGMAHTMLQDVTYIKLESRDFCDLGEAVLFQGQPLLVYSVTSELRDSEMIHTYLLKRKEGFSTPKQYNYNLIGASVEGRISDVKNDTVKVQMAIDQLQNTATAKWFAYSTVYSSPDGTGWYCMPEKGDRVRIYFPNEKEEEAYAISSINLSGGGSGGSRSNPDHKSISTKYGKTVELTPTTIVLTNNKGMSITMDDSDGITIVSDQDITIESKENLSLSSTSDAVNIQAAESIELVQGGTKITLKDDVIVEGAKFKLQ